MLFSPVWGLPREIKRNFLTSCSGNTPKNVYPNDFKILKKQKKSENHEICQYLVISYVEAVVKNWVGFVIFLRTMLTNENISGEESESWEGCG